MGYLALASSNESTGSPLLLHHFSELYCFVVNDRPLLFNSNLSHIRIINDIITILMFSIRARGE